MLVIEGGDFTRTDGVSVGLAILRAEAWVAHSVSADCFLGSMVESTLAAGLERVASFITVTFRYLATGSFALRAGGAEPDSATAEPRRSEVPLRIELWIPAAVASTRLEGGIRLLIIPVPLGGSIGSFAVVFVACATIAGVLDLLGGGDGLATTVTVWAAQPAVMPWNHVGHVAVPIPAQLVASA